MQTRLVSVLLALVLAGTVMVSPSTADGEDLNLVSLSLGFPYSEDFQNDDGGWTTTDLPPPPDPERPAPTTPTWEWGEVPTQPVRVGPTQTWERGVPTHGPETDNTVFATGLHDDYERYHCAGIMSPPIDLTGAASASVSFEHWYSIHATSTLAQGGGMLFVTTDGGETLDRVEPERGYDRNSAIAVRACLDNQPTNTWSFTDDSDGWLTDSVVLDAYVDQTIQFVFGFAAGTTTIQRAGWYIDTFTTTIDGVGTTEDFESGDGGFTQVAMLLPAGTLPPGGAHSGDNAWGTMLSGAFSAIECSGIMSPPIDLTGAQSASLSFHHWKEMRQTTSAWHGALVFATTNGIDFDVIEPDGGYDSEDLALAVRNCLDDQPLGTKGISGGPDADWTELSFDLDEYLGADSLQIVIGFRKDTTGDWNGLFIDTWTTTIDGQSTVEDFSSGDGGFSVVGVEPPELPPVPLGWEWGAPTVGPGVANGTNLWATQLHRDYGHFECSWIESPAFTVGPLPNELNVVLEARLAWQQWFRSNSIYASGIVQIGHDGNYTLLEPEGGYPATIGSTSSTFVDVTKWQTDCFGMEWEQGDPLHRGFSGFHDALGDPLEEQRADLTPWVGEEITLRFLFASGWRDVNPATHPGWYVDDIEVELRLEVSVPSPERLIGDLTSPDAPGWSSGGPDNEWAWGAADGGLQYGTNLVGPYGIPHCGYIESPAVSGSVVAADPTLEIEHRYGLSQSGSFAWYSGVVLASADDGPWQLVDFPDQLYSASTPSRTCVNTVTGTQPPTGTPAFGAWELDWHSSATSLAAFADADEVRFRFVMGGTSTAETGCSDTTPCDGWYIRGVQVGGQELLALPDSLIPGLPI